MWRGADEPQDAYGGPGATPSAPPIGQEPQQAPTDYPHLQQQQQQQQQHQQQQHHQQQQQQSYSAPAPQLWYPVGPAQHPPHPLDPGSPQPAPAHYPAPYSGAQAPATGVPVQGYPVPPPGMPPYQQQPGVTFTQQVVLVPAPPPAPTVVLQPGHWPPFPVDADCPRCKQRVTTRTVKAPGLGTWLICAGLCFVGCGFGCCLIPFCVDAAQDTVHHCPRCDAVLGAGRLLS